jgi:hypothetical protein
MLPTRPYAPVVYGRHTTGVAGGLHDPALRVLASAARELAALPEEQGQEAGVTACLRSRAR